MSEHKELAVVVGATGAFGDLLVEVLGVRREPVCGRCHRVPPEAWSIGGAPASVLRAEEVAARARAAAGEGAA
ncbi:hypothetical protein SAMN04244573_01448 [Azotobacter beijerinckii]|uniref:Uncharacterized protein n=1 Tax=Azotobacter beijerinckii TaxID=170623 RepID=A0A1H6VQ09_9GAMM|nr:hypothetical protein [Azotobacter beijerinckii]SEJ05164.1 hypothetical protein SAMN04244579_02939 [Azotobacter beijerinckii]SEQ36494.1 hypothetical protein SAMN04244573_01448 [Azotobacter beijerinckii]